MKVSRRIEIPVWETPEYRPIAARGRAETPGLTFYLRYLLFFEYSLSCITFSRRISW